MGDFSRMLRRRCLGFPASPQLQAHCAGWMKVGGRGEGLGTVYATVCVWCVHPFRMLPLFFPLVMHPVPLLARPTCPPQP
jgi:hypothetical protein